MTTALLEDLKARGLFAQSTADEALAQHLDEASRSVYCGFDPTADSLHIGSLVPLTLLKRFQEAGHRPIGLLGGATGLIGDPSFKATERQLNTPEVVQGFVDKLKVQVSQFIDFDHPEQPALLVNNYDWMKDISVLDFLRDIGKHFSINNMIQKESVKQRIDREGAGISFTEFSYILLQSYDFAELYKRHQCTLQLGGSDQWGNITGGIDLTRRLYQGQTFGWTSPLITKADGTKFGKTESGTIWLDPKLTSPYAFYQFWMNVADADVYRFLKYFTFLSVSQIDEIELADQNAQGRPQAQRILAEEVTRLVHGPEALASAERITQALFSGSLATLTEADFAQLAQDGLPHSTLDTEQVALVDALVDTGLAKSRKMAREFIGNGAVLVQGEKVTDVETTLSRDHAAFGQYCLVKRGKKLFHLLSWS